MPDLISEMKNHVLIIALSRPDRLNDLSPDMREGLIGLLQEQTDNLSCRAVLIRGNDRGFVPKPMYNLIRSSSVANT